MTYRKLIWALVFAAFGFCFSEAARAQTCDPFDPFVCFDPACSDICFYNSIPPPSTMDGTTGSTINCTYQPGGTHTLNIINTTTGNFGEAAKAVCTHTDNSTPPKTTAPATCDFQLQMDGVTLTDCVAGGNCHVTGFCQNVVLPGSTQSGLKVTGSLTCPVGSQICAGNNPCIMNFGIGNPAAPSPTGHLLNNNQCNNVFPAVSGIFSAGQVVDVTVTTDADGAFVSVTDLHKRWCNSGDFANSLAECSVSGVTLGTKEVVTSAVPFQFDVVQTVNTSPTFCKGGKSIDKGGANVEVFGSPTFIVANVDQSLLSCEGAPLTGCTTKDLNNDGFPDLACNVATCPDFGINLGKLPRNADGTVTATCTGELNNSQAILGFGNVAVSPK